MAIDFKRFNEAYRSFVLTKGKSIIQDNETFRFECPSECWGTCCGAAKEPADRPINIVIGPPDVYRLGQALGMKMREIVMAYCSAGVMDPDMPWPVVQLRNPAEGRPCVWLTQDKRCGIRDWRPEACRSVPVVQVRVPDENGNMHGVLQLTKAHKNCIGLGRGPEWTPITWQQDQQTEWQQEWYGDLGFWTAQRLAGMNEDSQKWWFSFLLELLFNTDGIVPADIQREPVRMWRRASEAVRAALRMKERGSLPEEIEQAALRILVYGRRFRRK